MSAWVTRTSDVRNGEMSLQAEVALPQYALLTNQAAADLINTQTEPDPAPVDMSAVRRTAIEARVWGKLMVFATRPWSSTDAALNTLTYAAQNFMSMFREGGSMVLIRSNAIWNAMDADLTVLTGSTGGGPVLTTAQANFMRAFGDRVRPKWAPPVPVDEVVVARMP